MKRKMLNLFTALLCFNMYAQDWKDIPVPADAGDGYIWQLQENVSDDFNYSFSASSVETEFGDQWINYYHNTWEGPGPTQWRYSNVNVSNGSLNIEATRNGTTKTFTEAGNSYTMAATQMGCVTSKYTVKYPVFIESRNWIPDAVMATAVWMLSADDTEEIDIMECYGGKGDDNRNSWYAARQHLSHHMFVRSPFQDYQPSDKEDVPGTWYWESGRDTWIGEYHRIGVYWKSPQHLEYYIDGKWVRTLSGNTVKYLNQNGVLVSETKDFNVIDKYNYSGGTYLSKSEKIIMQMSIQGWNAVLGRHPTDTEISERPEDHILKIDWIRAYQAVEDQGTEVSGVSISPTSLNLQIGQTGYVTGSVIPESATNKGVWFTSSDESVATITTSGVITPIAEGNATITVISSEGFFNATCELEVTGSDVGNYYSFLNMGSTRYMSSSNADQLSGKLQISDTEIFEVIELEGNEIAIKGSNGKYICSNNGDAVMDCNSVSIGNFEKFILEEFEDGIYAIKANNNKYVRNSYWSTSSSVSSDHQLFQLVPDLKDATAHNKVSINELVTVFPNPVCGNLNIQFSDEHQLFTIELYDLKGTLIRSSISVYSKVTFNTDGLKGIYLLKIIRGNDSFVKKVIVK